MPNEKEWELAAQGNMNIDSFPFGIKSSLVRFKGRSAYAFNCIYDSLQNKFPSEITATVDSYYPNSYGCYNMIGNVSEMVAEKGIAKGGNFLLPLDSCKIKMEQHYTKAEAWLGFRCVCEIVK